MLSEKPTDWPPITPNNELAEIAQTQILHNVGRVLEKRSTSDDLYEMAQMLQVERLSYQGMYIELLTRGAPVITAFVRKEINYELEGQVHVLGLETGMLDPNITIEGINTYDISTPEKKRDLEIFADMVVTDFYNDQDLAKAADDLVYHLYPHTNNMNKQRKRIKNAKGVIRRNIKRMHKRILAQNIPFLPEV